MNEKNRKTPTVPNVTILHTIRVEGEPVIDMVNTRVPGQMVALVDFATIHRLAELLPTADLDTIKSKFIDAVKMSQNIDEYVFILNEELAFHKTVNMLRENTFEIQ